jgi:hypothetical protein
VITQTLRDLIAGADLVLAEAGTASVAPELEPLRLFTVARAGSSETAAHREAHEAVFRAEGDVWLVGIDGAPVRVRAVKGFADIAMLLARPGREVHVAELVGAESVASGGGAPVIDRAAIESYRGRLADLADDERDADERGDAEAATRARAEREAIMARLAADLRPDGRPRAQDDWVERARKAVRARVAHALKRIEVAAPAAGRHLRASIRTGEYCAYEPPEPVRWQL